MDDALCDELTNLHPNGESLSFAAIRSILECCWRAYRPDEFFDRYSFPVIVARHNFEDVQRGVHVLPNWPAVCPAAGAALGALALINNRIDDTKRLWTHVDDSMAGLAIQAIDSALAQGIWLGSAHSGQSLAWPVSAMLASLSERVPVLRTTPYSSSALERMVLHHWKLWLALNSYDPPNRLRLLGQLLRGTYGLHVCSPGKVAAASLGPFGLKGAGAAIQACWFDSGWKAMLRPTWVSIWRGLDRLSSWRTADIIQEELPPAVKFKMSLFPPHIAGSSTSEESFRFVADFIRASSQSHCHPLFLELADHILGSARLRQRRPLVVDIGAHLGDCCLWAAERWKISGLHCHAFDCNPDAVAVMRHSIKLNGFSDRIFVHERNVGSGQVGCTPGAAPSNTSLPPLDALLQDLGHVDLLKVHTGGRGELHIVNDVLFALRAGRITALCLRSEGGPTSLLAEFCCYRTIYLPRRM